MDCLAWLRDMGCAAAGDESSCERRRAFSVFCCVDWRVSIYCSIQLLRDHARRGTGGWGQWLEVWSCLTRENNVDGYEY